LTFVGDHINVHPAADDGGGKAKYVGRKSGGMDCPQCGGPLATYALGGREASVCEDCGYVGIAAEHRGEARTVESWDDALRRFYHAHDTDAEPGVELQPPLSRPSTGVSDESWDEALRRFYARTGATDGDGSGKDASTDGDGEADAKTESDDDTAATDDTDGVEADAGGGQ
jgi:DNA-directed RNA polymerase subunit M/transcription elongation factor TFIIS